MTVSNSIAAHTYPVMEHFYTIQGEGYHQGRAAYFVRLAGCDVGCVWCDVKESWQEEGHPILSIEEIVANIRKTPATLVVVTGGEPLMHDLGPLTGALRAAGLKTNIETSGAHPLSGTWDWICLSPKKFKAPIPEVIAAANELKVIVYNHSDFAWGESFAEQVNSSCRLFLQPEWSRADKMTPAIVDYIKEQPCWELSLQVHKYIGVP